MSVSSSGANRDKFHRSLLPYQVVDEVGSHVTFRYEGLLPLADQELLALLDILVNKDDLIQASTVLLVLFMKCFRYYMHVTVELCCLTNSVGCMDVVLIV